ncbi:MAG: thioredoxin family protein [Acidimicrobiia bacterium]
MKTDLPDGLVAIVKRDCPTCTLVAPVLAQLRATYPGTVTIFSQDDPAFPEVTGGAIDDRDLEVSFSLDLDTVPTLIRVEGGTEVARTVGWSREHWTEFTGITELGPDLPPHRPGCGSRTQDPAIAAARATAIGAQTLQSRRLDLGDEEDDAEAMYERGWSDGLPLVPPTPARVVRMLAGTTRDPQELVATIPPDLVECTVEKVAINAVMAGCRPEYLPVVLAAVEAACTDEFNMHGLLATTWFSGPVVIVNGPIAKAIGMNNGINALGPGNRANATIGRALQLVVRNVGGGRPGDVDRATLGQPGKYTCCFAEHEDAYWEPMHVERGYDATQNTVTLFAGEGVRGVVDQLSRTPESLTRSFAACLRATAHPKLPIAFDAMVIITPDHLRVYEEAGWSKAKFREELGALLQIPGTEMARGADGIEEGVPESLAGVTLPKFRDGGLLIAHAGGGAGLFSGIMGGWASGKMGSEPVTREIGS